MSTKKIENSEEESTGTKKIENQNSDFSSVELKPSMKLNSGNYEILGQLGKAGGFGITYLGYDVKLKSKVAIKEYFPRTYANRESVTMRVVPTASKEEQEDFKWGYEAFVKEAQTIANLPEHPNVVNVKTLFEENGTAYYVMSYAEGEDLESYVRDYHPMTQKEIEDIIFPLLDGIKHIHKYDILHRDIKLANILIKKKDNQPVLIDFGTARNQLLQRSKKLTAVYTEGYAALEQHTQSKEGPYTDIYAIGMVIYAMMNGITDTKLLPTAIKRFEAMHTKGISLLSFPDDGRFTKKFIDAVKKATAIEAKDRPQSVDELIALFKKTPPIPINIFAIGGAILGVILAIGGGYIYYNNIHKYDIPPFGGDKNSSSRPGRVYFAHKNIESTQVISDTKVSPPHAISKEEKSEKSLDVDIDYYNEGKLALSQGDTQKAIDYLKKSANRGNPLATFELGEIYDLRLNKLNSAIKWYSKAVELGNTKAKYPLAILYCQKGNFAKFNKESGILEYAKNARKEVKYDVGLCYNNMGDINSAKKWFEESAKMGYNRAKENLYILLRKEFGYSDKKAREHIDKLTKE